MSIDKRDLWYKASLHFFNNISSLRPSTCRRKQRDFLKQKIDSIKGIKSKDNSQSTKSNEPSLNKESGDDIERLMNSSLTIYENELNNVFN